MQCIDAWHHGILNYFINFEFCGSGKWALSFAEYFYGPGTHIQELNSNPKKDRQRTLFKMREKSEIIITPEPLNLRAGVPVDDIAFFILEIPGNDYEDIPFADPDFLFNLALDSPHPCYAIKTTDTDMVCPHHQFCDPKHLPVSFLGQFYPDDLITRR